MQRRLTIVHTEWSSGWGGQERRIIAEAGAIAALGHRVLLISRPDAEILAPARAAGLETSTLPLRSSADLVSGFRLAQLLRRVDADVLNTHSSIDAWIGALAARASRTPLLRTRHIGKRIQSHPLNFVHRLADRTVTAGEAMRRAFLEDTGVAPDSVVSVPTGIDTLHFAPPQADPRALRHRLSLRPDIPIVASIAVLRRDKRLEVLLAAFAELRQRRQVHLVLAGDGGWRPQLEAEVKALGIAEHVSFLGHVDDVRWVLAGADVIASASVVEGVPQALTQALAMQRPVAAADTGSVGEVVQHERTGLLVPIENPPALASAIERLLADPEFASALARRGREHVVAQRGEARMVQHMLELYTQLAERRR